MSGPRESRRFEKIIDICIDEISMGRMSVADALDRWPEHREELGPLLEAAFAISELPTVDERAPAPERRADLLSAIRRIPQDEAPQDAPRRSRGGLALRSRMPSLGSWFGVPLSRVAVAVAAVPAAAVALVAIALSLGGGATTASASTLTVFAGGVEREQDGSWVGLEDGAVLAEGDRLRTSDDGHALLTFGDGSTAALDPATELVIEEASVDGARSIELRQLAGRIWNDVAPGAEPASYVVRTADAVIEAHGTTFETLVSDGETSVVTAEGAVEVVHGDERTSVTAGQVLRVARQEVVAAVREHRAVGAAVTFTIEGPFVASLRSASGAATGALPNGVMFQQIPGVWSTDPGEGPQRLRFFDVAAGEYEFTLRRTGGRSDGPSQLRLATPNGGRVVQLPATLGSLTSGRVVQLPATLGSLTIRIEIAQGDSGLTIRILDSKPRPVTTDRAPERIVDSPRLQNAEPVSERRATLAADARAATAEATRSPEETATPEADGTVGDLESRLRRVLELDDSDRRFGLRLLIEELGRNEDRWLKLRQILLADDQLRRVFIEAVREFDSAELRAAIWERLGLKVEATDDATSLSTATPIPTVTATPSTTDADQSLATATPTPTPEASLDSARR